MRSANHRGAGNRSRYGVPLLNLMCPMPREWIDALERAAAAEDVSRADLMRAIVATWLVERDLIAPPSVPSHRRNGSKPS